MDTNFIMFHFLSSKEEVDQFMKYPDDFLNYILRIKKDIKPPIILSPEKIAEILYQDKDEVYHLIEVKNGPKAGFTGNQKVIYPKLQSPQAPVIYPKGQNAAIVFQPFDMRYGTSNYIFQGIGYNNNPYYGPYKP